MSDDETAWAQFLVGHVQPVVERRAAMMLSKTPKRAGLPLAEDLAQDVLERLLKPSVRARLANAEIAPVCAYALRTLHRRFIDVVVRKRRESLSSAEGAPELESPEESPERTLIDRDLKARRIDSVRDAIQTLEPNEAKFLALACAHGAPEAQRRTGWPPGTKANACRWAARLLDRVRARLEDPQLDVGVA